MDISITNSLTQTFIAQSSGRMVRTVRVGEPLYLVMPLSGQLTVPPSVQWMRNGADIAGATETPYTPVEEDVGEDVLNARGTLPDGTPFKTLNAVTVRSRASQRPEPRPVPVMLDVPRIGSVVAGQEARLDFGTWEDVETLTGTILRDGKVHLPDLAPGATVTWTEADAGARMVLRVEARGWGETVTADSEPVTVMRPLAPPRRVGSLEDEIFDIDSGEQTVEAAHVFEGEELTFAVSGANATIDPATGVITIPTEAAFAGVVVTVTASNAAGSDKASFQVTIEDEEAGIPEAELTTQSSITDIGWSDETATLSADAKGRQGINGGWLLRFKGPDDEIRITGFSTPSTTDGSGRVMHGCMVAPFLGGDARSDDQGFDSYVRNGRWNTNLNVDPSATGEDIVLRAADWPDGVTVVKAISKAGTPTHGNGVFENYFQITIVPHDTVVPEEFWVPPHRQRDKRKVFSYQHLDLSRIGSIDTSGLGFSYTASKKTTFPVAIPGNEYQRDYGGSGTYKTYGVDVASRIADGLRAIVANQASADQKKDWLCELVDAGLNCAYAHKDELEVAGTKAFYANGAHMNSRLYVAALAATLLQDDELLERVGRPAVDEDGHRQYSGWHEKDHSFVVSDGTLTDVLGFNWADNDLTRTLRGDRTGASDGDAPPFREGHVGMPYFGTQHALDPKMDDPDVAHRYSQLNFPTMMWVVSALRVIDGAIDAINWPPEWAVLDRYVRIMRGQNEGQWEGIGPMNMNYEPSDEKLAFYDAAVAASGYMPWTGQPETPRGFGSISETAPNELTMTWDPFLQPNGGSIVRYDVLLVPRFVDEDEFNYTCWYEREPIVIEDVAVDGSLQSVITDSRIGQVPTGVEWRALGRIWDDSGNKSPDSPTGDTTLPALTNEGTLISWKDPVVSFPSLLGVGETMTVAEGAVWTGSTSVSPSYRWERSSDGSTWSTISGATGTSYTFTEDDVGSYVRPVEEVSNSAVEKVSNSVGSAEVAGTATNKPIEADPQPMILQRTTVNQAPEAMWNPGWGSLVGKILLVTAHDDSGVLDTSATLQIGSTTAQYLGSSGESRIAAWYVEVPAEETAQAVSISASSSVNIEGAAIFELREAATCSAIALTGHDRLSGDAPTSHNGAVVLHAVSNGGTVNPTLSFTAADDWQDQWSEIYPGDGSSERRKVWELASTRDGSLSNLGVSFDRNYGVDALAVSTAPASS